MSDRILVFTRRLAGGVALFAGLLILVSALTLAASAPPTEAIDTGASCTASCHLDFGKKAHLHKAAKTGTSCKNCHKPVEPNKHAFKPLPENRSVLCLDCHDEMEATKKQLHKPFKTGNCIKCHDPHQSDEPKLLKKTPQKLCLGCHDEQEPSKKHLHKPFKAGNCTKCHDAHQSDHEKQLKKPVRELCLGCHDEQEPSKKHLHKPFKTGNCAKCHDAHQSDQPKQLKKPLPQLCMGCHEEDEFKGKVVHGPVAEGKCMECHHPHQGENARLLKKPAPELCFSCHASALKDAKGHSLPATKKQFEDKNLLRHPPFAEGKCEKCHQPHVSATRRLLAQPYPADFYATYSAEAYGLCFSCHTKKAFEEPRTLADTRFRNGNLNLHNRHVNREKGRTCGACHAPHGSPQTKLVNQAFRFGNKSLQLIFEKTETGGGCTTACHGPIKYDRCKAEEITMMTTPRQGNDATQDELKLACETELKETEKAKEAIKSKETEMKK